ncbi:hypothetical protein ANCCAN_03473 [Ancylostoma caninum]|uniref:Curli production assembly/transport component CsgF n=1 Tax=Ancylostoma caninum TaxID=29170 RepID=A0A368H572_ANCCA|nr:hypothetical protein ANCCAN_03473 [Ancylostoma caninum]
MHLSATLAILFLMATVHAQNFDPFGGFNPFQGGVFSPDWGANLAKQIMEATKNAQRYGGITSINGVTTVTQDIGGRMYTAQLPPNSSVSTQSTTNTNNQGQLVQTVVITVNGDVTVYTTVDGRTTVTDGSGHIRMDGGPFHINSAEGHN